MTRGRRRLSGLYDPAPRHPRQGGVIRKRIHRVIQLRSVADAAVAAPTADPTTAAKFRSHRPPQPTAQTPAERLCLSFVVPGDQHAYRRARHRDAEAAATQWPLRVDGRVHHPSLVVCGERLAGRTPTHTAATADGSACGQRKLIDGHSGIGCIALRRRVPRWHNAGALRRQLLSAVWAVSTCGVLSACIGDASHRLLRPPRPARPNYAIAVMFLLSKL